MNGFVHQPTTEATRDLASPPAPQPNERRPRTWRRVVIGSAVAIVVLASTIAVVALPNRSVDPAAAPPAAGADVSGVDASLGAQLTYLVEEEKLAHDIYVLGESHYGTRVFSNISRSETQHQESIRALLTTYGLKDPSANEAPGVFTDPALQSLYDSLAARVNTSSVEAMKVGVLIEQTDIADLDKALAADPPSDVATVLTRLEAASRNHLQAFERNTARA